MTNKVIFDIWGTKMSWHAMLAKTSHCPFLASLWWQGRWLGLKMKKLSFAFQLTSLSLPPPMALLMCWSLLSVSCFSWGLFWWSQISLISVSQSPGLWPFLILHPLVCLSLSTLASLGFCVFVAPCILPLPLWNCTFFHTKHADIFGSWSNLFSCQPSKNLAVKIQCSTCFIGVFHKTSSRTSVHLFAFHAVSTWVCLVNPMQCTNKCQVRSTLCDHELASLAHCTDEWFWSLKSDQFHLMSSAHCVHRLWALKFCCQGVTSWHGLLNDKNVIWASVMQWPMTHNCEVECSAQENVWNFQQRWHGIPFGTDPGSAVF